MAGRLDAGAAPAPTRTSPLDVQRDLLRIIERAAGRPVGIATSCGLGRRDDDAAMARTAALAG